VCLQLFCLKVKWSFAIRPTDLSFSASKMKSLLLFGIFALSVVSAIGAETTQLQALVVTPETDDAVISRDALGMGDKDPMLQEATSVTYPISMEDDDEEEENSETTSKSIMREQEASPLNKAGGVKKNHANLRSSSLLETSEAQLSLTRSSFGEQVVRAGELERFRQSLAMMSEDQENIKNIKDMSDQELQDLHYFQCSTQVCFDNKDCTSFGCDPPICLNNAQMGYNTCGQGGGAGSRGVCGSSCFFNSDCSNANYCQLCMSGVCSPRGGIAKRCDDHCYNDNECSGGGCQFCISNRCQNDRNNDRCNWGCTSHSYCRVGNGRCSFCNNGICQANNQSGSTCSRQCSDDRQCAQGPCVWCSSGFCI
jgi:hypothetical protein